MSVALLKSINFPFSKRGLLGLRTREFQEESNLGDMKPFGIMKPNARALSAIFRTLFVPKKKGKIFGCFVVYLRLLRTSKPTITTTTMTTMATATMRVVTSPNAPGPTAGEAEGVVDVAGVGVETGLGDAEP